jgi:hypothetical protein
MRFTFPGTLFLRAALLWLPLLCASPFTARSEDALIEGGLSPDRRYEVRKVRVLQGELKGAYTLDLFDAVKGQNLMSLHPGGYFAYDQAEAGACAAFWHPSSRFFALLNVEKREMTSLFLYATDGELAREIPLPDYALLALTKFKEGKQGFLDGFTTRWPEWIGNELHFQIFFKVPPPKKRRQEPAEYSSFAVVTPVLREGRYRAELHKLSRPLPVERQYP